MIQSDATRSDDSDSLRETQSANGFQLVVIASSAGGVQALMQLVADIPDGFRPSIVVVQHVDPRHRSLLVEILRRRSALEVSSIDEETRLAPGTIYVAPPGLHVLVNDDGTLSLSRADLVHFVRPSADLLFESAAASFADQVIAVVLTGTGQDGARGTEAVKKMGGTVIVQDQATSAYFGMPGAAIATGCVDFILPLDEIGGALMELTRSGEPT